MANKGYGPQRDIDGSRKELVSGLGAYAADDDMLQTERVNQQSLQEDECRRLESSDEEMMIPGVKSSITVHRARRNSGAATHLVSFFQTTMLIWRRGGYER